MSAQTITTEIVDHIGVLTFNRPQALNAFDPVLIKEAIAALARFGIDDTVHSVVVRGAGRAFSAGFDLKASAQTASTRTAADWRRILDEDFDFIMAFWDCPKPTVAAVHGYCIGGAFEVALACDMTIAAESTRFGEPEVRFGSGVVAMLLPWFVGPKATKELLLTGEDKLDARRARDLGIVNRVVPDGEEFEAACALARDIAAAAPTAVRLTKLAINRTYEAMGLRGALAQALEIDIFIESSAGPVREEFNRIRREQGLKAALAWRDGRFAKS